LHGPETVSIFVLYYLYHPYSLHHDEMLFSANYHGTRKRLLPDETAHRTCQ